MVNAAATMEPIIFCQRVTQNRRILLLVILGMEFTATQKAWILSCLLVMKIETYLERRKEGSGLSDQPNVTDVYICFFH